MLYALIALLAIVAVGYLIVKRAHAAASIFFVGVFLLMVAAATGKVGAATVKIKPTGNAFYDELLVVESLFGSRFSGIGMAIMVLFGFVAYMRHIGADAKAVVVLSKPLQRFKGSYWMVPVGFLVGNLLSLVVPSASALSLLLVATLLPALVAAGLTPLTVGAIVVTSSTIMPTPLEAGLIQGAKLVGMTPSEYVFGNVAKATIPTLVILAFVHMWWQRRCDKKDAAKAASAGEVAGGDAAAATSLSMNDSVKEAVERAKGLPGFYALLPLLPLLLIIVSAILNRLKVIPFEAGILQVTVVSLFIAVIIEMIRHRSIVKPLDAMGDFWKGMGEGAAGVVALLVAAAVLIEGITQLGVIRMLINLTSGMHGAGAIIIMIFVLSTAALAALTGSGTAPYFAFSEVVPAFAQAGSVLPVRMLTSIWGTSNLMRQASPVCAAVLVVAGAINVNPIELVKRTAVPMVIATVLNVLFSFLLIWA